MSTPLQHDFAKIELSDAAKSFTSLLVRASETPGDDIYEQVIRVVEAGMLRQLRKEYSGNQSAIARKLGINRATLRSKLKKYNLI